MNQRVAFHTFFVVADTRLSSGHPAYGVRGYSSPENMYSMNWETYSFMRTRHVPVLGMLWGGQFVAHVMQWCRLPRPCQAHQFQIREVGHGGRLHVGYGARGLVSGRSA